jgi:hypothetical protein
VTPSTQVFVESYSGTYQQAILLISIIGILLLPFVFLGRNKGTLTVTYSYVGPPRA